MTCHVLQVDAVLGQQGAQQDHAGGLDADLLALELGRAAHRVLGQREECVGVLLPGDREAADRQVLRHGQHQRRAGRHLADFAAAGRDGGDAVVVRAARHDLQLQPLLGEVAELQGHGLAQLVAAADPAELHFDGLRGTRPPVRHGDQRGRGTGGEQRTARDGRRGHAGVLPGAEQRSPEGVTAPLGEPGGNSLRCLGALCAQLPARLMNGVDPAELGSESGGFHAGALGLPRASGPPATGPASTFRVSRVAVRRGDVSRGRRQAGPPSCCARAAASPRSRAPVRPPGWRNHHPSPRARPRAA